MLNFIKNVFAVLVGLSLFTLVSILGLILIIFIATSSSEKTPQKGDSILKINLDKELVERESEKLFMGMNLLPSGSSIGLIDLKEAIDVAGRSEHVKAIYLDLNSVKAGFASLEEIRNSLVDFKKTGKPIVAYGENYSEGAYYIASIADKIYLAPTGSLELNGLESEPLFFKGTLDKLEIQVEVFKVGTFKSAVEPFIQKSMSDSNRLQVTSFLNAIYNVYLENVSKSRGIDLGRLNRISDSMLIRDSKDALQEGLITNIGYASEVEEYLIEVLKLKESVPLTYINYTSLLENDSNLKNKSDKIAVIIANGEIVSGKGNDEVIGSESLSYQLKKAREDDNIKAVVLRINSPGGSALASDIIWNEVLLTKKVKPIIASMSDVAASGGYYIAMGCDSIMAQPTTITGSIGVFGLLFNAEGFLENKLGVTSDRVKTGEFSDLGSPTRSMTPFERTIIQKEVNQIYEDFTLKASQGRNMSQEALKLVAEGRVWSGKQALRINLVDKLGGIEEAIAMAAEKAGIALSDAQLVYLPEQKNKFWKELLNSMDQEDMEENSLKAQLGFLYPYYKSVKHLNTLQGIQARLPYSVVIK